MNTTRLESGFQFWPRLLETLKGYWRSTFSADLVAGLSVGIVVLLSALAVASGLNPGVGIFTAIIGGFFILLLGVLPVRVGGSAGVFVPWRVLIMAPRGPQLSVGCVLTNNSTLDAACPLSIKVHSIDVASFAVSGGLVSKLMVFVFLI